MGENFFKEILDGLDVNVIVRNKDGLVLYKNGQNDIYESLDIISDDVYIDRNSKKKYHKTTKDINGFLVETYYDISKFLEKKLSLDITDENVVVRDENGNIVYNNLTKDMYSNLKLIENDIYFYPSSNSYFQKHVAVSDEYNVETYHDVTQFIVQASKYTIDALTGLPVRAKINEYINEISKKESKYIIAMMDIDNFKIVNDTYGHLVGDEVLKRVATVVKDNIRGSDFAGRYGGEEFILFFETDNIEPIMKRLNYIRSLISYEIFSVQGFEDFNVTVSVGACSFNSVEDEITKSIDHADQALYYVKQKRYLKI